MSTEGFSQGGAEKHVNSLEDLEAARKFIEGSEILRLNEHVQDVLDNDFVLPDGREIDAKEFVKKMEAFLTERQKDPMVLAGEIEKALAIHSESTR